MSKIFHQILLRDTPSFRAGRKRAEAEGFLVLVVDIGSWPSIFEL